MVAAGPFAPFGKVARRKGWLEKGTFFSRNCLSSERSGRHDYVRPLFLDRSAAYRARSRYLGHKPVRTESRNFADFAVGRARGEVARPPVPALAVCVVMSGRDPSLPLAAPARRLALVGSRAVFTHDVLAGLLARRLPPAAVLLYGHPPGRGDLPVETPHDVDRLAYDNDVAVNTVRSGAQALHAIRQCGADVALAACFPRRLPVEDGLLPPAGLFNLHPAPLPAYRGPTPLFWQFRAGVTRTAISLHAVKPRFDEGDVLAREWLALPPDATFGAVSRRLADLGAGLAVTQLVQAACIAAGEPQTEAGASYHGIPDREAFEVSSGWPAERLYRFVVGTGEWGRDYRLRCDAGEYRLQRALGYLADGRQQASVREHGGGRLSIRCTPGLLDAEGARVG